MGHISRIHKNRNSQAIDLNSLRNFPPTKKKKRNQQKPQIRTSGRKKSVERITLLGADMCQCKVKVWTKTHSFKAHNARQLAIIHGDAEQKT